jgi:hypothetical protein
MDDPEAGRGLVFRLRVAWILFRLWLWWGWRRKVAGHRFPLDPEPDRRHDLPPIDTGGTYRPAYGSQFGDPSESHTTPHSEGSNCTMASAGMALEYHTGGRVKWRGGTCRHHQSDNDGGTDLYDAAECWARAGETLSIRSGQGWSAVQAALNDRRGVILQGTGGVKGCGNYTGGHAIYVQPEASGTRWLKGDPECSGWEWTEARDLEAFAERLSSGVYFAVTKSMSEPAPQPDCPDCPDPPTTLVNDPRPDYRKAFDTGGQMARDDDVRTWVDWYGGSTLIVRSSWGSGQWQDGSVERLVLEPCPPDPPDGPVTVWGRGPVPSPADLAKRAVETDPVWSTDAAWTGSLWGG